MSLFAYHGSNRVHKAFLPNHGDEGGVCLSLSPQVAGCYGAQVHRCDVEAASLYPMSVADWKSGIVNLRGVKNQGFDGVRVIADPSHGVAEDEEADRTFHHDLLLIWATDKIRIAKVEEIRAKLDFGDLPGPTIPPSCRLSKAQFQALGQVHVPKSEFKEWFHDLYEDPADRGAVMASEALRLDTRYDFLREVHSLTVREDGRWDIYELTPEVEKALGPHAEIVLYHMTSTAVLPQIAREGLRVTGKDVNRQGESPDGVFLSSSGSGTPMDLYGRAAEQAHGGDAVLLEVACRLADLRPDLHDADIRSGRTQFMVPQVQPGQIVNLARVLPRPTSAVPGLSGRLPAVAAALSTGERAARVR
jgi:hypothetical protein